MSFNVGTIEASSTIDQSGFNAGVGKMRTTGDRFVSNLSASLGRVGRTMTTMVTAPLVAGIAAGVREAANLEGAIAKFDVVFQGANEEMHEFVDTFRDEFPIARSEIVKSAAALGDLLIPMGVSRKEATGMTKEWLELAGALSAFNDVPMEEALRAIESGIGGMSQPLRRFGIDVRQTTLEQTALEAGLISAGEAMSEQVRQQALLIQATNQSADAINGLEEQKGSLLWVLQGLKADIKDFAGELGNDLLPIVKEVAQSVRDLMERFRGLDAEQRKNILRAVGLAAAIGPVLWGLSKLIPMVVTLTRVIRTLTAVMMRNPWLAVAAGIALVIERIISANRQLRRHKELVQEVMNMDISGTEEDMKRNQQAIAAVVAQMEKMRSQHRTMGVEGSEAARKSLAPLQEQLDQLIKQRQEIGNIIVEQRKQADVAEDAGDSNARAVEEITRAVDSYKQVISGVRPLDDIIDADIRGLFDGFDGIDITPPQMEVRPFMSMDTLAGIREAYQNLEQQLTQVTTQEERNRIMARMESLQAQEDAMLNFTEGVNESLQVARDIAMDFTNSFGAGMANVVVQGEKLTDVLKNIGKLLLSSAIQKGIQMLLMGSTGGMGGGMGFLGGGGLFGRIFTNDALISNGRVVHLHPNDDVLAMKDFSNIGGGNRTAIINLKSVNEMDSRTIWEANRRYEVSL